jgi:hypothetical protein
MTGLHPDLSRWESASGPEREALLAHLGECDPCQKTWTRDDPARIFALLRTAPIPPSVLDAVSRGVATAVVRSGAPRAAVGRTLPRVAAVAAALILSLTSGWLLLAPERPLETVATSRVEPLLAEPRAGVELLSSPGTARVVDLTVGDTQVVMIFDEGLDL